MPKEPQNSLAKQPLKNAPKRLLGQAAVDKGVAKPVGERAAREDSIAARLRALEVGETESRSMRLPGEGAVASVISQMQDEMRNSFAAIIRNAKARMPNAEFATAVGEFRARDGDVIVTIAVTRTA